MSIVDEETKEILKQWLKELEERLVEKENELAQLKLKVKKLGLQKDVIETVPQRNKFGASSESKYKEYFDYFSYDEQMQVLHDQIDNFYTDNGIGYLTATITELKEKL